MTDTLTAEFIKSSRVVFRPKTPAEVAAIQQWMFRNGIIWKDGKSEVSYVAQCIAKAMIIEHGMIMYSPSAAPAFEANSRDLDGITQDDFLTAEERMNRRIAALETSVAGLHGKLDQLIELLAPAKLGKPVSVVKKAGHQP